MTGWGSTVGSKQQIGTLNWNTNGTLQSQQINDQANSTNNQTCTYTYDDLGRASSGLCDGSLWGQDFNYDAYGNINKTISTAT